jgi:hypothetical protein
MTSSRKAAETRINRLLYPAEAEVSCEQCFDALDRCVELALAGVDYEAEVPGMRAHLAGCAACREEFDSVLAFAATDRANDVYPD